MLSSNMLLPNLIPLIEVTFSTPTPYYTHFDRDFTAVQSRRFIKRGFLDNLETR
jgi:hypothetical protein